MTNVDELGRELATLLPADQVLALGRRLLGQEHIAVVSAACRFPRGVTDLDRYWNLTVSGGDAVTEIPPSRWAVEPWFDLDPKAPDRTYSRWGAFLDDVSGFEPRFFGIAPKDAGRMDPQQRLLLELSSEALELAGVDLRSLASSSTGVFVGAFTQDWFDLQHGGRPHCDPAASLGSQFGLLAAQISYWLDLHGPAMVVETACSSSLVALHMAAQSLRQGECDIALVGGVQLFLTPRQQIMCSRLRMLSPRGRCHVFDEHADGIVLGEGAGMVVLKRLGDAERNADPILAVLRGSAINHDGRTLGVSAPNPEAQRRVLEATVHAAGVEAADVGYVEAHGTGTAIGDPAELESIQSVYGAGRKRCFIGSSKATFGHTVAASGIAALCRAFGVLRREVVPPQLHLTTLNRRFALDATRFRITTEATSHATALVAVSNFGNSGTNAHAIFERPPARHVGRRARDRSWIYMVSEPDEVSHRASLDRHAAYVEGTSDELEDLSWTSCFRRTKHRLRTTVVARTCQELAAMLRSAASEGTWTCVDHVPPLVWVFPDTEREGAARALAAVASLPGVEAALDGIARVYRQELGAELWGGTLDPRLATYALQIGFAHLLRAWGCTPDVVVGEGLGEHAARCVSTGRDPLLGARAITALVRDVSIRAHDSGEDASAAGRHRLVLRSHAKDASSFDALLGDALASFEETPLVLELSTAGTTAKRLHRVAKLGGRAITVLEPEERHSFMDRLWALAADLQTQGIVLDSAALGYEHPDVSPLPTHPWQREPHWVVPSFGTPAAPDPLALLQQHRLGAGAVVPGAALLEPMFRGQRATVVRDIRFEALLRIAEGASSLPRWELRRNDDSVEVWSEDVCHLTARVDGESSWPSADFEPLEAARLRCRQSVHPDELYEKWRAHGVHYGPAFRAVQSVQVGDEELVAELRIAEDVARAYAATMLHPITLDAALHVAALLLPGFGSGESLLPQGIDTVSVRTTVPPRVFVHARRNANRFDLVLCTPQGDALASIRGLRVETTAPPIRAFVPGWQPLEAPKATQGAAWACLGDAADALRSHLVRGGRRIVDGAPNVMFGIVEPASHDLAGALWQAFREIREALDAGARRILFVTRRAVMPPIRDPFAAAIWGAANALALEYPNVRWDCVDVERWSDLEDWARFELPDAEDRVALRDGKVFGLRWQPAPAAPSHIEISERGVVVVTGGTGGVGAQLCRALRDSGIAHVVALSRHPASVSEAGIEHLRVDIEDSSAVESALETLRSRGRRIEGIVHCAGEVISQSFVDCDPATLERVTAAKIRGAMNLVASTRPDPLRFLAFVSSISGTFGAEGQAAYAAANAALDALAASLRERGVPAVSCAFGPWSNTGALRRQSELEARLTRLGAPPMQPRSACLAFLDALGGASPRIAIASFDLPRWFAAYERERARACWSGWEPARTADAPVPGPVTRPHIESVVRTALTTILDLKTSDLDTPRSLLDLGMTSLGALDLRDRLEMDLGVRLPSTSLWSQPSVTAVVDLVEAELKRLAPPPSVELPELSDDALAQALLDELSDLGL